MKDVFFKTLMLKGESGAHVSSFEKVSTVGNVDTYVITFDDGTTEEFTVTNGNGIESIVKTSSSGLIDTYTITFEDGDTTTFEITNGSNGAPGYEVPAGTVVYYDNSDLPQGYEPATNPDGAVLEELTTSMWGKSLGTVNMTGDLETVANYLKERREQRGRWVGVQVFTNDSVGYFGNRTFWAEAMFYDESYAFARFISIDSKMLAYGRLFNGTWTFYKPTLTEIE